MRGLGAYPAVGLEEARKKAAEYRAVLTDGIEPPKGREAVQKKDEGRTFAQVNERYLSEHKGMLVKRSLLIRAIAGLQQHVCHLQRGLIHACG